VLAVKSAAWGPGPWDDEPDRLEWVHAGLPCVIRRNRTMGVLLGYVGIPTGHRVASMMLGASEDLRVHDGVTFHQHGSVELELDPDLYWVGFDCGHAGDLSPLLGLSRSGYGVYRDITYVRSETEHLADQLAALDR